MGFSGTASTDPNGDALTYTWNFGDGTTGTGATVSHTYTNAGQFNATLTVNDRPNGAGLSNTSQPIAINVNSGQQQPPTPTITAPLATATYKAGDTIAFSGTATDPKDGALAATAFSWTVQLVQGTATQTVATVTGQKSGSFQVPLTGTASSNQLYRITLTAIDSSGLSASTHVDIQPQLVDNHIGDELPRAFGQLRRHVRTGRDANYRAGHQTHTLSAPTTQTVNGVTYTFASWSDGGAATHTISTPATATSYTATYSATSGSVLPTGFQETLAVSGLNEPSAIAMLPDGRMLVVEKPTDIRIIKNGVLLPTPFLTPQVNQSGDRGILGITLDPNFATNGYFYVYYTHTDATAPYDRLSRFKVSSTNPDVADPTSETVLLDGITTTSPGYDNGGFLRFGADGMLYLGIGDLMTSAAAQDLSKLNGKVLRLDVDHLTSGANSIIPPDNPFVNTAGARPEIYAYGFRNPSSGDVLPGTNTLFVNDVGSGNWEEVNALVKGANYGWPNVIGPTTNPSYTTPTYAYAHVPVSSPGQIAGGAFYTGSVFPSQYAGSYFFGDYAKNWIHNYNPTTGVETNFSTGSVAPDAIVQAPDGSLYWVSHGPSGGGGAIYHITYTNHAPTAVAAATSATTGTAPLTVNFSGTGSSDPDGDALTYSWSFGDGTTGTGATVSHTYTNSGQYNATLTVNDRPNGAGLSNTSQPIAVNVNSAQQQPPTATITQPLATTKYKAGDTITFAGTASDPHDGTLPASAYAWSVVDDKGTVIASPTGITTGTFQIPLTGDGHSTQFYRVTLTVTDSLGLKNSSTVQLAPQLSTFTLATNIAGLSVNLNGASEPSPTTITSLVNVTAALSAPAAETVSGKTYYFTSWSDGGAATHNISTPATATTYTANYALASAPTATITKPANNATYKAGDTITFAGTATDPHDGTLPASAYAWSVVDDKGTVIASPTGITTGTFQIPLTGDGHSTQFYRVTLTVTDSAGLTNSSTVQLAPQLSTFTLATNIAGLSVNLDGTAQGFADDDHQPGQRDANAVRAGVGNGQRQNL